MELIARISITIPDEQWQEEVEEQKAQHQYYRTPESWALSVLRCDLGKGLSQIARDTGAKVEFIEFEEPEKESRSV